MTDQISQIVPLHMEPIEDEDHVAYRVHGPHGVSGQFYLDLDELEENGAEHTGFHYHAAVEIKAFGLICGNLNQLLGKI